LPADSGLVPDSGEAGPGNIFLNFFKKVFWKLFFAWENIFEKNSVRAR
jgi:hypothetical protein